MNYLSFVSSMLLIFLVSTTTFGSAAREKNPNAEQREAILEQSHQANAMEKATEAQMQGMMGFEQRDTKISKRIAAAVIIAGASLGKDVLKATLDAIANVKRKVAIGIENETGFKWEAINTYFFSGTSDEVLPMIIPNGKAGLYGARNTEGPVATGVVGVLAYYVPQLSKTLAVMFSVPFDYNLYQNWWNVKLYDGKRYADYNMYYELYYNANPFKGNNARFERHLGSNLKFQGSMSSSGAATLEVHVLQQ